MGGLAVEFQRIGTNLHIDNFAGLLAIAPSLGTCAKPTLSGVFLFQAAKRHEPGATRAAVPRQMRAPIWLEGSRNLAGILNRGRESFERRRNCVRLPLPYGVGS
jgi:hypothetical protein